MRKVCDATALKSTANAFATMLLKTASADANRPPKTSSSGNASSAPRLAPRTCRSAPPLGSSLHAMSRATSGNTPRHALTPVATPLRTYSQAERPRRAAPRRLRLASERTIARPIASNARRKPESRATKFEPRSKASTASQEASRLAAMRRRRTSQAAAATSPVIQSNAFRPQGVTRSRASPAIPSAAPAPRISRPNLVRSLRALIPRPPRATRRSGAGGRGIRRSPRRGRPW